MFYTKVARVIAPIALFFGIFGLLIGGLGLGWYATSVPPQTTEGLGNSFGQMFDFGVYSTLAAVVIGVLSDISRSLSKSEATNT